MAKRSPELPAQRPRSCHPLDHARDAARSDRPSSRCARRNADSLASTRDRRSRRSAPPHVEFKRRSRVFVGSGSAVFARARGLVRLIRELEVGHPHASGGGAIPRPHEGDLGDLRRIEVGRARDKLRDRNADRGQDGAWPHDRRIDMRQSTHLRDRDGGHFIGRVTHEDGEIMLHGVGVAGAVRRGEPYRKMGEVRRVDRVQVEGRARTSFPLGA